MLFPKKQGLEGQGAHRNRSDFCDLRLRCPSRTPKIARFPKQETAMPHCDLRVRWKVASDLRFRAAISEPKTPSVCGISGDLAQSTRKSLAIAIVRFWCAKSMHFDITLPLLIWHDCLAIVCPSFLPFFRAHAKGVALSERRVSAFYVI